MTLLPSCLRSTAGGRMSATPKLPVGLKIYGTRCSKLDSAMSPYPRNWAAPGAASPMRYSCSAPREHTRRRFPWPRPGWSAGGYWRLPVSRCPRVSVRYCRPLRHFVSMVIACSVRRLPWRGVTAPSMSSDSWTVSWCSPPDRPHHQAGRPSAAASTSPTSRVTQWFSMVCR